MNFISALQHPRLLGVQRGIVRQGPVAVSGHRGGAL
jgi:hypothetical protein